MVAASVRRLSPLVWLSAGPSLLCVGAGVGLAATGHPAIGSLLIICGPVGVLLTVVSIAAAKKRSTLSEPTHDEAVNFPHRPHYWSGNEKIFEPAPTAALGYEQNMAVQICRWVGGMNIPTAATGRISATFPMAILEITPGRLAVQIRPRWARKLLGVINLEALAGDGTVLFPVRQLAGVGVGIRQPGQPAWYFRSFDLDAILMAASSAGFDVERAFGRWGR